MPNIRTVSSGATGATRCNRKASARSARSTSREAGRSLKQVVIVTFASMTLASLKRWRGRSTAGPSHWRTSAAPGGIGPEVGLGHQVLEITLGESDRSRSKRDCGSLNQISQPTEFKALRKPPNALSRQGSLSPAAFERSRIGVRLISVVFGFDLERAAVATFFVLGSCRWRLITLEESTAVASDGAMRSSTGPGCVGVSLFA